MTIAISPTARRHIAELAAWWDANRPAARVRVEDALDAALDAIARHPQLGRIYTKQPRYRMWRLKATPYYVFYRVDEQTEVIRVAAVWSAIRSGEPEIG